MDCPLLNGNADECCMDPTVSLGVSGEGFPLLYDDGRPPMSAYGSGLGLWNWWIGSEKGLWLAYMESRLL